ncbi:hypothetical protein EKH57_00260 (plasmid) [Halorubrum sp. BOL3-1]|uniref:hypothetical protein n=1 Tax=Halorubrum sp. BOL3-1 TaxID=2497325 RepID=UPI00100525F9|nr:hypothetical protein [Halorubrum sp. BOL3-1]QAU11358.1 hypothetical protein EKH57_00260 [Halorubrum sp. BOL3-1]
MTEPSESPPEAQRFDEFVEIAVDGKPIYRLEEISDLKTSDIDEAAFAYVMKAMAKEVEEELEEEYDKNLHELLREAQPEIAAYDSEEEDWKSPPKVTDA